MGYHIAIIDDSAVTRACIARAVRLSGVPVEQIHEAANGRCGLELVSSRPIDLVLADLHMPEMGGSEMAQRLLSDPATSHIPVVVISAEPNVNKLEDLKRQGVHGYLRKPFTPEAIRNLVTELLGVARA